MFPDIPADTLTQIRVWANMPLPELRRKYRDFEGTGDKSTGGEDVSWARINKMNRGELIVALYQLMSSLEL